MNVVWIVRTPRGFDQEFQDEAAAREALQRAIGINPITGERRNNSAMLICQTEEVVETVRPSDPRDPRPDHEMVGRAPIFRDHNCARCKDGERACVRGDPGRCDWPHARND